MPTPVCFLPRVAVRPPKLQPTMRPSSPIPRQKSLNALNHNAVPDCRAVFLGNTRPEPPAVYHHTTDAYSTIISADADMNIGQDAHLTSQTTTDYASNVSSLWLRLSFLSAQNHSTVWHSRLVAQLPSKVLALLLCSLVFHCSYAHNTKERSITKLVTPAQTLSATLVD